jgi:cytochrome P450
MSVKQTRLEPYNGVNLLNREQSPPTPAPSAPMCFSSPQNAIPTAAAAKSGDFYPPGPKGLSVLAHCLSRQRNPLADLYKAASRYGDIVHMQLGRRHDYLINHPDYIKAVLCAPQNEMCRSAPPVLKRMLGSGLLTSQGDYHRRHKRMLAPTLHKEMVRQWSSVISTYCERLQQAWRHGIEVDIEREMLRLTLGIVLKTLVSAELEQGTDQMAKAANTLIEMTDFRKLPVIDDLLDKIAVGRIRRFKEAKDQFDTILYRMIHQRRTDTSQINDLLCVLLWVRDEDGCTALTDEEVRDEALSMLIAGHETTAHALTWTWYLLSQHPEVEQKLHSELDAVISGGLPRTGDLESLSYTRMVFSEAMRLYPPLWIIARRNPKAWSLGNYTIPPGSFIYMSQYLMHRDARFFCDPDRFDPERWRPEMAARRPKYSYFPFGGGPRQCIGEGFAWTVGLLVLSAIAQRWRLVLSFVQRIGLEPLLTLRPKYGMRMILEKRKIPML